MAIYRSGDAPEGAAPGEAGEPGAPGKPDAPGKPGAGGPGLRELPLLPLRDIIVFPHTTLPLFVGRPKSVKALEQAVAGGRELMLIAQRKAAQEEPGAEDLHRVGTIGAITQLLRLPDQTVKVLVEGRARARIHAITRTEPSFMCQAEPLAEPAAPGAELEALVRSAHANFEIYAKHNKELSAEVRGAVAGASDASRLADSLAVHLKLKAEDRQRLLELVDPAKRLEEVCALLQGEIEVLEVQKRIRGRIRKQMVKSHKEYYLNEQMRAIQKELGERDDFKNEIAELEQALEEKQMPDEARARAAKEIRKLNMMSPTAAEATVVRNYIDWLLALPWDAHKQEHSDITGAERVLNEDHYGLEKPKERILEYLAVQSLVEKMKGPILCLVGPPGVGKTSLGRSIARATGRDFARISLGGVRDEAEIRGHRRTYIGALPGKILQGLKKAGSGNPIFLLDEVDKMSVDFRGDPSSALLEVLDPEQNHSFNDHYLDLDYDLSSVMFVCTANVLHHIPRPLQDRMEVIELPGYIESEKLQIARNWLAPKQRRENGLEERHIAFTDAGLIEMIRYYTRESGVRSLERAMASIARKVARQLVKGGRERARLVRITPARVRKYLGVRKFRHGEAEAEDRIGLCIGLAYTDAGGEMLQSEVAVTPGKGKLVVTGRLGEVMQESANAALSYIRSRAKQLGLVPNFYSQVDLHIHVPEGATPKDGPSAGITIATALASALTRVPVRANVAMTGEITLRGRVLPIGGLKEKLIAAQRGGVDTVLIPKENEKDLKEIPANLLRGLKLRPVEHMDEVLAAALSLDDPGAFLREGDHVIATIFDLPQPPQPDAGAPAGVN